MELISIGEMSEICKVSKRTLRYYDVIGLIEPAYTNPDNGYRYYEPYQVGRVHLIKQMQELGISLDEIVSCVREKGTEISIDDFYFCLKKRETGIAQELKQLRKQQSVIKKYTSQYEKTKEQITYIDTEVRIEYIPRRYLLCKHFTGKLSQSMFGRTFAEIGSSLQNRNLMNYEIIPQIGSYFSGRRNAEDCDNYIGFFQQEKVEAAPFQLQEAEEGYYACFCYQGRYFNIDEQYQILCEYLLSMNYKIKDYCVEIYTLSPSIHLKEQEYITELQMPIYF